MKRCKIDGSTLRELAPSRDVLAASILCVMGVLAGCQSTGPGAVRVEETERVDAAKEAPYQASDPLLVSVLADSGEGSLRQAVLDSNASPGPDVIRFDGGNGVFGPPQVIAIQSELPEVTDDLTIDGYLDGFLWRASGVTISGSSRYRILTIAPGVNASVRNLTLADGRADRGGAILNQGRLVVSGVTLMNNEADRDGGAIANLKGELSIINSTLVGNRARGKGGGVASQRGDLTVTNSTFSGNAARRGGALSSNGTLLLSNSILANSEAKSDCELRGSAKSGGTHNIVERNHRCPGVLHEADPGLDVLEYFNGMTRTMSLGPHSLALNAGSNEAAIDENGKPLVWDQRGNGDPRFVAGYTDIGAFETQAFPTLVVDMFEDGPYQGCGGVSGDCPLRAAIRLAEASGKPEVITFDARIFKERKPVVLNRPLPAPANPVTIDASGVGGVELHVAGNQPVFESKLPAHVELVGIRLLHTNAD